MGKFGKFGIGDEVEIIKARGTVYEVMGYMPDCGVYKLRAKCLDFHIREEYVMKAEEDKTARFKKHDRVTRIGFCKQSYYVISTSKKGMCELGCWGSEEIKHIHQDCLEQYEDCLKHEREGNAK